MHPVSRQAAGWPSFGVGYLIQLARVTRFGKLLSWLKLRMWLEMRQLRFAFSGTLGDNPEMYFEYSEKVKALQKNLEAFMEEHIYPNESGYYAQIREGD